MYVCIYIIIYCNIILYVHKTKLTIVYLINYKYHKLRSFSRKSPNRILARSLVLVR